MIEIRSNDRKAAFAVTANAYPAESPYVPPMWSDFDRMLDPARNPLVTQGHGRFALFTALRDGRPLGRIVATIHDASNARHGTRRAQFGYFDCSDDPEIAAALLGAAEGWARERGMAELVGNFNLTAMQQAGVVTGGFDNAPFTDMLWSPPHLARLLEANGYAPSFPMTTFRIDLADIDPRGLLGPKQQDILADPAYRWMPIDRRHFAERLEDSRLILNDGFDANPMFVPPTVEEYRFQAGDMMWVIDKRISTVVHHKGEPVGAIIAIPDLNPLVKAVGGRLGLSFPYRFLRHRWTNRRAVIVYQSVSRAFHNRGLNGAMLFKVASALKAAGYTELGGTWIADVNGPSLRQAEKAGAKPLHRLHLFVKSLRGRGDMLDRNLFESLVAEASLAPSVHNIQPTRWRLLAADTVLLLEDGQRRLPAADPTGHDVRLSHGAALEGLSLACGRHGLRIAQVELDDRLDEASGLRVIARLTLASGGAADPLASAVAGRRSWRGRFLLADAELQDSLRKLAAVPDLLVVLPGSAVAEIAELADRAGFHFLCEDEHRRELLAWMRLSRRHPRYDRDGLNAEAMALGSVEAIGASLVLGLLFPLLRRIGLAEPLTQERAKTASGAMALFHRPQGEDPLETGRAFYRAWLAMAAQGLGACPISVLADWPFSNAALVARHPLPAGRRLVNVFRLGRIPPGASAARTRLPLGELIV